MEYRGDKPYRYRYGDETQATALFVDGGYKTPGEAIEAWRDDMRYQFSFCKQCGYLNACGDCAHIRALAAADRDGRLIVKRKPIEATCGSCIHFHPEPNRSSGPCDKRTLRGATLYVSQSRKACRDDYKNREEVEEPSHF